MTTPSFAIRSTTNRAFKGMCAGVGIILGTTAFAGAAQKVDVYLTSLVFGPGKTLRADSATRKIDAAPNYRYELTGTVRGTPGTMLAKLVKKGTPIAEYVDDVTGDQLKGSKFLKGDVVNPSGELPAVGTKLNLITKTFKGTRTIKGVGKVKISFKVEGNILPDGQCEMEITNVKFETNPPKNLGSITFIKGSKITVTALP